MQSLLLVILGLRMEVAAKVGGCEPSDAEHVNGPGDATVMMQQSNFTSRWSGLSASTFVSSPGIHNSDTLAGSRATTTIKPVWPGKAFALACTLGTSAETCSKLGTKACSEPERDTQEVLNSFLLDCPEPCNYVDIGCNIGYMAAHAAKLGATVDCYEPTPSFVEAAKITRTLNKMDERWNIYEKAVVPDDSSATKLTFSGGFRACGISLGMEKSWEAPTISIRDLLVGRDVKLLKIDIDSVEGALLHTVKAMIASNETHVETILVEMGDNTGPVAWDCRHAECPPSSAHPRGGDLKDFWHLQRDHGYDLYRLNTHTGREIINWAGHNVNKDVAPRLKGTLPMYSVRNMRSLEKILPSMPLGDYKLLPRWGVSFLLTKVQLAEVATHHVFDLSHAGLSMDSLNEGSPI